MATNPSPEPLEPTGSLGPGRKSRGGNAWAFLQQEVFRWDDFWFLTPSAFWIRLMAAGALGVLAVEIVLHALGFMFDFPWSEFRLGPTYAIRLGITPYPTLDQKVPLAGLLYGPVSAIAYLPIVLLPDPVSAMVVAAVLTVVYGFGPVVGMHWLAARQGNARGHVLGLVGFGFLSLRDPSLTYSLFSPAHDVLVLAFGMLAVLWLTWKPGPPGNRTIVLAAAFAALSTWSKPVGAFYPPALVLYLAGMWGLGRASRFLGWLAVWEFGLLLTMTGAFGARGLFFQMLGVTSRHEWSAPLGETVQTLFQRGWLFALVALGSLYYRHSRVGDSLREERSPGGRIALASLIVAACAAPIAIVGKLKFGGDSNAYSYCLYFLAASASWTLAEMCRLPSVWFRRRFAVAAMLLIGVDAAKAVREIPWSPLNLRKQPAAEAYRFARSHPGEIYFPWNPVVMAYAEHRFWTTEDGVYEPEIGKVMVPDATLAATLPPSPKYIAYPPKWIGVGSQGFYIRNRFYRDYTAPGAVAELSNWTLLARKKATTPSPASDSR